MIRTGTGYDVHRLVKGRNLILGGVLIPFEQGLLGHSDADVLVHAIIDSLLGAAGERDIGTHFPDTDDRYRGISSIELLKRTAVIIRNNGYYVQNIDSTVLAQAPRLSDYIEKMRENIGAALNIPVSMVNVKATTTEGLGFIGRQEGIAAQAVATLGI